MPQLQTIIVILIVACAAFYMIRRIYNSLKKNGSAACGDSCGCSGCNVSPSCEDIRSKQS
jgi:hypothetical protein